jgi:hypothetical protein
LQSSSAAPQFWHGAESRSSTCGVDFECPVAGRVRSGPWILVWDRKTWLLGFALTMGLRVAVVFGTIARFTL